jgi:chromate transporter
MTPSKFIQPKYSRLFEVAGLFLRLGLTSFGGPAVHIALMEEETVRRKKWLTREEFLDRLGAANLIPGPSSTELAIHLGYLRAGFPGLLTAGFCFILPAFLLVAALAWAYVRFGTRPEVSGVLYGLKPVVTVVVLQALWKLGRTALKTNYLVVLAFLSSLLIFLQWNALAVLGVAGLIAALPLLNKKNQTLGVAGVLGTGAVATLPAASLPSLFLFFLKVGSVLFGSGYVLLAFLQTDLVDHWHWLTQQQLLDTIAVGQATPGPVFTAATFIGYLLAGFPGAVVATIGIFLPAFVLVGLSGWLVPKIRKTPWAGAALDGVNAASLALMALVTFQMGRASLMDIPTGLIALASAWVVFRTRLNSMWLVAGGAFAGWALTTLH